MKLVMKYFADILTGSRLLVAFLLGWLGWTRGDEAWYLATYLLIFSWASDVLDGAIARRSKVQFSTWIGDHDLYFDMAVAVGVLIFLASQGSVSPSLAIIYVLSWIIVYSRFGLISSLGKLFQAPVYGWFIYDTVRNSPQLGAVLVAFIIILVVITWPRFPNDIVPSFLKGLRNGTDSQHAQ